MKHLPGGHQKIFQECEVMKSFIKEQVQAHRKTLNPDSPRDFIDCFLIRANEEDEINSEECNEDSVVTLAFELFTAGTETISNTLLFSLLAVIQYPHIQEKVQKEINTVVGPNRLPTCSDRTQMPYTNAVVHEIMRYVDIVPLALPHKASEDTSFRGFMIPKGTTIFPLLGSVLSDPECWKTPYDFNPENFLDRDERTYSEKGSALEKHWLVWKRSSSLLLFFRSSPSKPQIRLRHLTCGPLEEPSEKRDFLIT